MPVGRSDREADANDTYGEFRLALFGSLVGESQLRISKFESDLSVHRSVVRSTLLDHQWRRLSYCNVLYHMKVLWYLH